jgi:hypothetical protein
MLSTTRIPLRPSFIPFHVSSKVPPRGLTQPMPVITTLRSDLSELKAMSGFP